MYLTLWHRFPRPYLLQLYPKNPFLQKAAQHTGRLNVKFMIQARQLSLNHIDDHCCSALFRYKWVLAAVDRRKSVIVNKDVVKGCDAPSTHAYPNTLCTLPTEMVTRNTQFPPAKKQALAGKIPFTETRNHRPRNC